MSAISPVTVAEWCGFLRGLAALDSDPVRGVTAGGLSCQEAEVVWRDSDWPGREPASEEDVVAAEERLRVQLPPAYRSFLLTSNGWRATPCSAGLRAAAGIGWFSDLEPELLAAWADLGLEFFADTAEILKRCLLISQDDSASGHYLLLAAARADGGRWTAYEWWPGDAGDPEPYDDFVALVTQLWTRSGAARGEGP
ncbi:MULTISPECIES: SMI1/KNR4 family protein [Amycolatopsis]|uniref:SMI1/KNR4 family protein n=1 Tax=Amycolatopsis albidoflavus TaxID=102226 RepID=A0ABW5HRW2_9PSEU